MNNKDYENNNRTYGNYNNKSYVFRDKIDSLLTFAIFVLIFIVIVAAYAIISIDNEKLMNPKEIIVSLKEGIKKSKEEKTSVATSTKKDETRKNTGRNILHNPKLRQERREIRQQKPKPKSDDIIQKIQNNGITEEYKKELEKRIELADLDSLNQISMSLKDLLRYKSNELTNYHYFLQKDKSKSLEEKRNDFKNFEDNINLAKKYILNTLYKINERRTILEKPLNIKNINNFFKMNEEQLKNELDDYLSGKYTYRRDEKYSTINAAQQELIHSLVDKNYSNLLDEFITRLSEKNQLIINRDYYYYAYSSVSNNHLECFNVFLKHGIDLKNVNDRWNSDYNIIHLAASEGLSAIVDIALKAGIPIDQRTILNFTPLYLAIKNDKYDTVEFLINNGALTKERLKEYNNYGNILFFPIRNKNLKMLDLLARNGIIVDENLKIFTNDRSILRFISSKGTVNSNYEVDSKDKEWEDAYKYIKEGNLEELIKIENSGKDLSKMYYDGVPAICIAVEHNKTNIIEYLVNKYDCKKLIDEMNGRNALHYAAMEPSLENFDILLENGFNPNEFDYDKNTPLNFAIGCNYNQPKFVTKLLEKGANPNLLNNKNQNSLFFLTDISYIPLFKSLKDKGADLNHQDSEGNTPLHNYLLKSPERKKMISFFISKETKIYTVNNKLQTPLHLAILINDIQSVNMLISNRVNLFQQDINGNTGLHYVALYAPYEKMLREMRVPSLCRPCFNIKNIDGKTPLDIVEPNCFLQTNLFKNILRDKSL